MDGMALFRPEFGGSWKVVELYIAWWNVDGLACQEFRRVMVVIMGCE